MSGPDPPDMLIAKPVPPAKLIRTFGPAPPNMTIAGAGPEAREMAAPVFSKRFKFDG